MKQSQQGSYRNKHKNQLCFYTLAINYPRNKLRKQSHLQQYQRE